MHRKSVHLPPIGMRIVKSSVGVMLGFVTYFLRGCQGAPFYTALSVLWCMRPYDSDSKNMAMQRVTGTFLGGLYGLIFLLIVRHTPLGSYEFLRFMLIGLCIVPIIYTTVALNRRNASYFACVVFLSITVMHVTDSNPYLFVLNRVLDTLIGIVIGIVVNRVRLPRQVCNDVLFVSGFDHTIATHEKLSNFSKVELNRMLDSGMNFTLATARTPANLVEDMRDIRLRLPVVTMNGAALFDMKKNHYVRTVPLSQQDTRELRALLGQQGVHVFTNVVEDDIWMIFYGNLQNEAECRIFETLRCSPYRNYIHREPHEDATAVYLMMIDRRERVEEIYSLLEREGWTQRCRVISYDSADYPDYRYIKIYNREATRENMTRELANRLGLSKIITLSNANCDVVVSSAGDPAVKALRRLYEPYAWEDAEHVHLHVAGVSSKS